MGMETFHSRSADIANHVLPSPFPPATGTATNHQEQQQQQQQQQQHQASAMTRQDTREPYIWVPRNMHDGPPIGPSHPTTDRGRRIRRAAFPTRVSRPSPGRRSEADSTMLRVLQLIHAAAQIPPVPGASEEEEQRRRARVAQLRMDHQARRNRIRAGERAPRVPVENRTADQEMTNAPAEEDDLGVLADEFGNLGVSDDIDGEMQVDTRAETPMPFPPPPPSLPPRTRNIAPSGPTRHRSRMEGYRVCSHKSGSRKALRRAGFESEF
ncbi:hypothetical protein CTA2_1784 [Colletotrichum tanaceti]|nr:hypothetical protein CTA2_1784 [Colletotrichum tanaceti]